MFAEVSKNKDHPDTPARSSEGQLANMPTRPWSCNRLWPQPSSLVSGPRCKSSEMQPCNHANMQTMQPCKNMQKHATMQNMQTYLYTRGYTVLQKGKSSVQFIHRRSQRHMYAKAMHGAALIVRVTKRCPQRRLHKQAPHKSRDVADDSVQHRYSPHRVPVSSAHTCKV